jgi:hypothetical protein
MSKRWTANDARPRRSKFERFCRGYGIDRLAAGLAIQPSAVYHWLSGNTAPRRTLAAIIQELALEDGLRLTLDEIYAHARDLRAAPVNAKRQASETTGPRTAFAAHAAR